MADISTWSATAAGNNFAVPDGFPEGMKRSDINNCMREYKAAIRRGFEDSQFFNYGDTPTRTGNTTFTVPGDQTSRYHQGRAIKCTDSSTLYGFIVSSVFSSVTTVTVKLVSGNLSASLTKVAPAIFTAANTSYRNLLYSEMRTISVDTTLDPSDMGGVIICTAAVRVTLPALAGFGFMRPSTVTIINRSAGTVTLIPQGETYLEKVGRFTIPANGGVTMFYTGDGKALRAVIDSDKTAPATKGINAIHYDTTAAYIKNANPSVSSKKLLMSVWFRVPQINTGFNGGFMDRGDASLPSSCFILNVSSAGQIQFTAFDSGGTTILSVNCGTVSPWVSGQDSGWHHLLIAVDTDVSRRVYLDDVQTIAAAMSSGSQFNLGTRQEIGRVANPIRYWNGDLSEFYINFGEWLDLDVTANRRKFIDASLKPVSLGADGSTPTGSAPDYYLGAPFDNPGQNLGTPGNPFSVMAGTFTNATTYPSD